MNEELPIELVLNEYRGIVSQLTYQAALNGALITKLRADIATLRTKDADNGKIPALGPSDRQESS